nr:hypothetical protein [Virgibacillus halodenitrificans]
MGRLIKRLIRYGPVIYPIVRKFLNKRKNSKNFNRS